MVGIRLLTYSIAIISITTFEESTSDAWERFQTFRWLLGCHIAFLFLEGGFWLNFGNFFVQVGIFSTCEIAGHKSLIQAAGLSAPASNWKRMSWLSNHWWSSQLRRRAVKVAKLVEPSGLQLMPLRFCRWETTRSLAFSTG